MIKRFALVCSVLFLAAGAYASPWAALEDYDLTTADSNSAPGEKYLLKDFLSGKTVRIYIESQKQDDPRMEKYQQTIRQLYQDWFDYPVRLIQEQQRTAEFKDVLPSLQQRISIEFTDKKEEADILFLIAFEEEAYQSCRSSHGCYLHKDPPQIILARETLLFNIIRMGNINLTQIARHEIGHSLGLADQYKTGRTKNAHDVYTSSSAGKGLMNHSHHFSCDEADGIINLIDITRQVRTERNENGWHSLCQKSADIYSYGKTISSGKYAFSFNDISEGIVLQVYTEMHMDHYLIPWAKETNSWENFDRFLSETPVERNVAGQVQRARGPHGEDIYYTYVYDRRVRLVVQNGKVISFMRENIEYKDAQEYSSFKDILFLSVIPGKISYLNAHFSKKEGKIQYIETPSFTTPNTLSINLKFNKHNQMISESVKVTPAFSQPATHSQQQITANTDLSRERNLSDTITQTAQQQALQQQAQDIKERLSAWVKQYSYLPER